METLILICLIIIIGLLLQDKFVSKKKPNNTLSKTVTHEMPDIMGLPKPVKPALKPISIVQTQKEQEPDPATLDIEYDENEDRDIQIPKEELDEIFSDMPDLQEEEDEWNQYGILVVNDGFAKGVTFEELGTVGLALQNEKLDPAQKEAAAAVIYKLQGTDLFSLLENSIEGASKNIAALLDSTISSESDESSSTLQKNHLGDFEIGNFI